MTPSSEMFWLRAIFPICFSVSRGSLTVVRCLPSPRETAGTLQIHRAVGSNGTPGMKTQPEAPRTRTDAGVSGPSSDAPLAAGAMVPLPVPRDWSTLGARPRAAATDEDEVSRRDATPTVPEPRSSSIGIATASQPRVLQPREGSTLQPSQSDA